ncbi:MAG: hypothetical protein IKW99_07700 [Bacteroidales bacterium]|nr:hypothetical protein [Bacteroidales bacterium]
MEFTSIEKQAVISLLTAIVEADGFIEEDEIEFAEDVLATIECTDEDIELGQQMPIIPALVTIKRMTDEQKDAVADVIVAAIVADRVITPEEVVVFDYVSELTGIYDIIK